VNWPNGIIGHSRFLQQNLPTPEIAGFIRSPHLPRKSTDGVNEMPRLLAVSHSPPFPSLLSAQWAIPPALHHS
jgi:hypothetical protein